MKTLPLLLASLLTALPAVVRAEASDYEPLKVIKTSGITFPISATQLGARDGEARVIVQVDEKGALTDYLVTSYTLPAFAEKAVAAIKTWRFEPARYHGQPRSAVTELSFQFQTKGIVVVDLTITSFVEQRYYSINAESYVYRARTLHELDRIPAPTKIVRPVYTPAQATQSGTIPIEVEFYIDESGHVRLPSVSRETNSANEELSAAAIAAVSQWNFEPPMSHGRPVLVLARQEFKFQPLAK